MEDAFHIRRTEARLQNAKEWLDWVQERTVRWQINNVDPERPKIINNAHVTVNASSIQYPNRIWTWVATALARLGKLSAGRKEVLNG